jgi:stage II sporulation protein D
VKNAQKNNWRKKMKSIYRIIYICISISSCVFASAFDSDLKQSNIRVLLEQNKNEALLEVCGPYYILNPHDGSKVSSGILGKRFIVRSTTAGIKWGQEYPGIHQIVVIPRSADSKILLNGIQYEGAISIYKVNDKLNIINEVDVESYLKSTLNAEFQNPLESEAMAAIAIAARTSAYFQIHNNKSAFWHINGESINYQGSAFVIPDSTTTQAIDATKNLILINPKEDQNAPFSAEWTDHSAGKTAAFHSIFRKDVNAPTKGVEAPLAALDRKDSRWTTSVSFEKFCSLFNLNKVSDIELFQDIDSNKVYAIKVKDGDVTKDIDFFTLQKAIGENLLKSNDFNLFLREKEINFIGYGKGHGVGICLFSASSMAQNGDIAVKILSNFFPNTSIINLSSTNSSKNIAIK